MRIRGLVGIAVIALLSGCGGAAVAAPEPASTAPSTAPAIDVEAIARDELASIDALGYPTELTTWDFREEFVNDNGGTAWSSGDGVGHTTIVVSTDADAYAKYGPDVEVSVRSTVRHEFGHALTYWLFPQGAEDPLSRICSTVSDQSLTTEAPAGECAAEAISELLTEQRGDERVRFYDLAPSAPSMENMRAIVTGAPTWEIPAA